MLKNIFSPVFYHQNAGKCRKMYSRAKRKGETQTPESVRQAPSFICNVLCLQP